MHPLHFPFMVETWTLSALFLGDPTLVWLCLDHPSITCTGAGSALGHSDKEEGQGCLKAPCRGARGAGFTWSLPSPCVCHVRDHPLWIVSWDRRLKEEKNIHCSGDEENYKEDKVIIYLPNFLNPIEVRSYFKSQYSLCFLTYLSLKWALAWVL